MKERIKTRAEYAFERFDKANPECYELFKRFTFDAIKRGCSSVGVALIIERIRWETTVLKTGVTFKISNNHKPFFSRKFAKDFPQYADLFKTRIIQGERLINVVNEMS